MIPNLAKLKIICVPNLSSQKFLEVPPPFLEMHVPVQVGAGDVVLGQVVVHKVGRARLEIKGSSF